jgi:hypothetical protein
MRVPRVVIAIVATWSLIASKTEAFADEASDLAFFQSEVLPILKTRCYACHSHESGKSKGGLVVDSKNGLLVGGESGPAITAGEPGNSLLIEAVRRSNSVSPMPPDNALPAAEIKILEDWIRRGAPDPRKGPATIDPFTTIMQKARTHWSLQPLAKPTPPAHADEAWRKNSIDDFVIEKQREQGLRPARDAQPRDLIRRLYFDLIGLPPTFEQVRIFGREFAADPDAAVAKLVDELLASPHYGERWGRHWLDLARYAEVSGGAANRARETRLLNAYTYRDYVIRALNADKPYDQFVLEQLAADQLQLGDKRDLAALGFLPVGSQEGLAHEVRAERIDTIGKVFMGLSLGCARCHDHKFDPISTEDFYALDGVFMSSEEVGVPRPRDPVGDLEACPIIAESRDPELRAARDQAVAKARQAVADYEQELWGPTERTWRELTPQVWDVLGMEAAEFGPLGEREYLRKQNLPATLVAAWRKWLADEKRLSRRETHPILGPWFLLTDTKPESFATSASEIVAAFAKEKSVNRHVLAALASRPLSSKRDAARAYGELFGAVDREWQTDVTRPMLPDAEREALRQILYAEGMPAVRHGDKWRNEFGNLADTKRNKLLAQVNDALFAHAGAPERAMLLRDRNPQDAFLLIRGEPDQRSGRVPRGFLTVLGGESGRLAFPSNRSGRLELARAIVDPANPLTHRVLVNRVWAHHFGRPLVETIDDFGLQTPEPQHRDLLDWLAATFVEEGWSLKKLHRQMLLSRTYRQSSVDHAAYTKHAAVDPDNGLLWRSNVRRLDFESLRDSVLATCGTLDPTIGGRSVELVSDPTVTRRTVYAWINRPLQPILSTFDVPDNSVTASDRHESTSPGQALFLMNGGFVDHHAARLLQSDEFRRLTAVDARIVWIFGHLLQREPTVDETARIRQFLSNHSDSRAWLRVVQSLLLSNEFAHAL